MAIIVFSFSPSFFFLFIGDDSDDGGPKLENFLANKFNIVKKKSVRINEYRFLANKFGILAKKDRKQYFTEASSRFFLSLKHGIFQDQLSLKNIQGA